MNARMNEWITDVREWKTKWFAPAECGHEQCEALQELKRKNSAILSEKILTEAEAFGLDARTFATAIVALDYGLLSSAERAALSVGEQSVGEVRKILSAVAINLLDIATFSGGDQ